MLTLKKKSIFKIQCLHLCSQNTFLFIYNIFNWQKIIFSDGFTNYYSQWQHKDESCHSSHSLNECFSIRNRDLNSLSADKCTRTSLLSAYIYDLKFDSICISETYLNSETQSDDDNQKIHGCDFLREDHPSGSKHEGVFACCKNSVPFKVINVKYLVENISFELTVRDKCWKFICLYRSPSHIRDDFETFLI